MTDNIFDSQPTPPVIDPPNSPQLPDHLKDMIGEGKKYASVEKALESIPHAQTHIQRIEEENRAMRERMAELKAAEEVYKKLMENNAPPGDTPPSGPVVDEASIASLLDRKLAERETQAKQAANVARVKDALVGKYGDKAQEVYETKAKELGVGVQFLNDLVKHSPKAAEELFGIKPKDASVAPSTPGINTAALNNRPPQEGNAKVKGTSTEALVAAWRAAKPE